MEYCFDTDLGFLRCSFYTDAEGDLILSDAWLNGKVDVKRCLKDDLIESICQEAIDWFQQNQDYDD